MSTRASGHAFGAIGRSASSSSDGRSKRREEARDDNDTRRGGGGGGGGGSEGGGAVDPDKISGHTKQQQSIDGGSTAMLIAVIADEDTVTGMLLEGVGVYIYLFIET